MKQITRLLAAATLGAASFGVAAGGHQASAAEPTQDIVATAASAGSFNTLLAAADAAGLTETLRSEGPFTVWAPTDDAFAALPAGTLDDLLKPENSDKLRQILLYHVVPSDSNAADALLWAVDGLTPTTMQGDTLLLESDGDSLTVNGANVVAPDVRASNGVIHVIDAVLIPPG
jgi:uncharacterized surface protein with fasciclin (FAS1) repeats